MAKFRQPPYSVAEANIISKSITANGTYNASSDNADGYDPVTVNVPSKTIVSKSITANGTYNASSDNADGYNPVTVNVPSKTIVSKSITANGTYNASSDSADGYDPVTVNVSSPLTPLSNIQTFLSYDQQTVEYVSNVIDNVLGQAILFNDVSGTYLSGFDGGATITLYERLSSNGEYTEVDSSKYTVEWRGPNRGDYYYIVNYAPGKYVYDLKFVIFQAYRVTGRLMTGLLS